MVDLQTCFRLQPETSLKSDRGDQDQVAPPSVASPRSTVPVVLQGNPDQTTTATLIFAVFYLLVNHEFSARNRKEMADIISTLSVRVYRTGDVSILCDKWKAMVRTSYILCVQKFRPTYFTTGPEILSN